MGNPILVLKNQRVDETIIANSVKALAIRIKLEDIVSSYENWLKTNGHTPDETDINSTCRTPFDRVNWVQQLKLLFILIG